MTCIFCTSSRSKGSYLPDTKFNNKIFTYRRCLDCDLIYINPIPNEGDLIKMYPPSYQNGVESNILDSPYKKLIGLRFSYGYQFKLLNSLSFKGKMLDYGCGTANFVINSNNAGYICDGAEFNPDHVKILKKEIPQSQFYTIDDLLASNVNYDLIRLSNVLEHFTDPVGAMEKLKAKLNPKGYFLIEGPIETNFNFALLFRKMYFRFRKKINVNYIAHHTPTHIIFTNLENQLQFFENLKLNKVHLKTSEAEWPFPPNFKSANGVVSKLNFIIARISIVLKKLNKKWGNTFIYVGQID